MMACHQDESGKKPMMDRQTQQAYLHLMGVPVWLPKKDIPGALASSVGDEDWSSAPFFTRPNPQTKSLSQSSTAVVSQESPKESDNASHVVEATVASLRSAELAQRPSSPAVNPKSLVDLVNAPSSQRLDSEKVQTKTEHNPSDADEISELQQKRLEESQKALSVETQLKARPHFQLMIAVLEPECIVVADCPDDESFEFTSSHERLLINILEATFDIPFQFKQALIYPWPILQAPQIDQSKVVAQQAVSQQVARLRHEHQAKIVVTLGKNSGLYSAGFEQWLGVPKSTIELQISYSLDDMLQTPSVKKEVWQEICDGLTIQKEKNKT